MILCLSKKAIYDLIISQEVSSKETYEATLKNPTWPGGNSGVTIGLGYDLAFASPIQLQKDWGAVLTPEEVIRLSRYCGRHGSICATYLPIPVRINWDKANRVFYNTSLKQYAANAYHMYPGLERLHPYELTAIVGLVYNRGDSLALTDRRREMKQLARAIANGNDTVMALLIRQMKRLWPDQKGLRLRRELEAKYIEMPDIPIDESDKLLIDIT